MATTTSSNGTVYIENTYYRPPPPQIVSLADLADGPPGSKPQYPYSTLIRYAILGSPSQKLLVEDIYYSIETRFPYFKTAGGEWKRSLRHHLSHSPCFEKVPRPINQPGKGSYWVVNDNAPPRPSVSKPSKKRKRATKESAEEEDEGPDPRAEAPEMTGTGPASTPNPSNAVQPEPQLHILLQHQPPALPNPPAAESRSSSGWRDLWLTQLTNLHKSTSQKGEGDEEWFKMMSEAYTTAFSHLVHEESGASHPNMTSAAHIEPNYH